MFANCLKKIRRIHGLRTHRGNSLHCTARPKIQSQSQTFRYGRGIFCLPQESRREGWTDARSAVGFCLGSGLFGSYNSD